MGEKALGFFHIITGASLIYPMYAATLNFALGFHLALRTPARQAHPDRCPSISAPGPLRVPSRGPGGSGWVPGSL